MNYKLDPKNRKSESYTQEDINGIVGLYLQCQSLKHVATIYKRGQQTIKRILLANNIEVLSHNAYLKKVSNGLELFKDKIIDLYCNKQLPLSKVAKEVEYSTNTVSTFLRKNKIKTLI